MSTEYCQGNDDDDNYGRKCFRRLLLRTGDCVFENGYCIYCFAVPEEDEEEE